MELREGRTIVGGRGMGSRGLGRWVLVTGIGGESGGMLLVFLIKLLLEKYGCEAQCDSCWRVGVRLSSARAA